MDARHEHYKLVAQGEARGSRPCAWCKSESVGGMQPASLLLYPPECGIGVFYCASHEADAKSLMSEVWAGVRRMKKW